MNTQIDTPFMFFNKNVKVVLRDRIVRFGTIVRDSPESIYIFEDNSTEEQIANGEKGMDLTITMIPKTQILCISLVTTDYTREEFLTMLNTWFNTKLK